MGSDALEIKAIENNVYINEAVLIPIKDEINNKTYNSGRLFLKGFVRKSIEYKTMFYLCDEYGEGEVKNKIIYSPISSVTPVKYNFLPELNHTNDKEDLVIMGKNKEIINNKTYNKKFNEPIYFDLIRAKIFSNLDFIYSNDFKNKFIVEKTFSKIESKEIVEIEVQLIQKQQVKVKKEELGVG